MKHLKVTSVVLTIAICMSMFMPTVSVLADEASAPSETQSTEETEIQKPKETVKPKETEKPAPKETAKPKETENPAPKETEKKETEPSEKKETEATEKPAVKETEKQEPENFFRRLILDYLVLCIVECCDLRSDVLNDILNDIAVFTVVERSARTFDDILHHLSVSIDHLLRAYTEDHDVSVLAHLSCFRKCDDLFAQKLVIR